MILALTDIFCTLPLSIFVIYINASPPAAIQPWISWSDTHYQFWRVRQIPDLFWRADPRVRVSIEFTRWMFPACAALFWALFGLAEEARRNYAMWVARAGWLVGYRPKPKAGHVTPWSVPSSSFSFRVA
jgi:pheromone a factor receptor